LKNREEDSMPNVFVRAIFVALLLLAPVLAATAANALSVTIDLRNGTSLNSGRSVTCAQGARIIRDRGFFDVVQGNCSGRYFAYRASRRGWRYHVSVRASDGRVVDYHRVRRL
jgi:hypothetical protein